MLLYCVISFYVGCLLIGIVSLLLKPSKANKANKDYPKICKNCNNFVPCVDSEGQLLGACKCCSIETYFFNPNMSCGHFEYTISIQTQINKQLLEKCFKK